MYDTTDIRTYCMRKENWNGTLSWRTPGFRQLIDFFAFSTDLKGSFELRSDGASCRQFKANVSISSAILQRISKKRLPRLRRDHDDPFINRDKFQRGRVVYDTKSVGRNCQVNMFQVRQNRNETLIRKSKSDNGRRFCRIIARFSCQTLRTT